MKISDKLLKKYAVVSPMLPPPDEIVEEVIVPTSKVPQITDISEDEMKDWEDWINEKRLKKDLDITKEVVDLGGEDKASKEEGTMPAIPKKKADLSPDALLKMCSQYHDLCNKF